MITLNQFWLLPPQLLGSGHVYWAAFAVLVPVTMLFTFPGVKLAYRLDTTQLKRVFVVQSLMSYKIVTRHGGLVNVTVTPEKEES